MIIAAYQVTITCCPLNMYVHARALATAVRVLYSALCGVWMHACTHKCWSAYDIICNMHQIQCASIRGHSNQPLTGTHHERGKVHQWNLEEYEKCLVILGELQVPSLLCPGGAGEPTVSLLAASQLPHPPG